MEESKKPEQNTTGGDVSLFPSNAKDISNIPSSINGNNLINMVVSISLCGSLLLSKHSFNRSLRKETGPYHPTEISRIILIFCVLVFGHRSDFIESVPQGGYR